MYTADNVCHALRNFEELSSYSGSILLPSCEAAVNWVTARLRSGVDENDPLILSTAVALAHYFFFLRRLSDPDKYESYKVGDVTVRKDALKLLQIEKEMRNQAIADAAPILKDCEFYCRGR